MQAVQVPGISLFDGKTFNGWKVGDHDSTFKIENGTIKVNGPVAHLFYVGDVHQHEFKNFELKAQVMTLPGSQLRHLLSYRLPGKGLAAKRF